MSFLLALPDVHGRPPNALARRWASALQAQTIKPAPPRGERCCTKRLLNILRLGMCWPAPVSVTARATTTRQSLLSAKPFANTCSAPSLPTALPLSLLDDEVDELAEDQDDSEPAKLKSRWVALEKVVGTEARVNNGTTDLVAHFEQRNTAQSGKAMVVMVDRRLRYWC